MTAKQAPKLRESVVAPKRRRDLTPLPALEAQPSSARSAVMARVPAQGSAPERRVRAALRRLGLPGYRLHRRDLPGTPDIAYIGRRLAIFVHGCFWHGHPCRRGNRVPETNKPYWLAKIERNRRRDQENHAALAALGFQTLVIWECETRRDQELDALLAERLALDPPRGAPMNHS